MYSAGIAKPLHPDLWVPGRKPLGPVEVDWSHPITRDLVVCLPFRESCGNTIRNLARPANDGVIEGGAINPSWLHTPGGVGLGIDQSGSSARNYGVDLGPNPATGQTPRTVFLVTYKRGTGANNYIVSLGPSASATDQDWRFRYDEGSASELRIEITGSFYRSSLIPPIGQVNAIACSYGGGSLGDHFLYLNGQYEKASGTTTPNTGGDFHFLAADPWSFTSSTSTGTTDVILFYCMWLRQLSHDEIFELTENPYQLLRPRTNFFWVPAVGGGQSVQLGLVSEAETAYAVLGAKAFNLGLAVETESAQPMQPDRALGLGYVAESETAMPVGGAKARQLGALGEPEAAHPLTIDRGVVLGPVAEGETVYPLSHSKAVQLGIVIENETAHPITVGGGIEQRRGAGRFDDGAFSD